MAPALLDGFSKADTNNLPYLDIFMMYEYFNSSSLLQPEAGHDKTVRSTDPHYGDKAIGFVQVKREDDIVTVRCLVRPQTRVRNEDYVVTAVIRDRDSSSSSRCVQDVSCKCSASNAMCKHIIAVIAWLNRRSDEESPTSVQCYWKKSSLADIGSGILFIRAKELGSVRKTESSKDVIPAPDLIDKVVAECKLLQLKECLLFNQFEPQINVLSMHFLMMSFHEFSKNKTYPKFIRFLKHKLGEAKLDEVTVETEKQSESLLWKELRYGRITASKLHETSRCKTADGSLVKMILGAKKIKDNKYMKRGRELETPVLKVVQKQLGIRINKIGLVLSEAYPLFGSSPDGINDEYVFEVKCPGNKDTFANYMDKNLQPTEKYEMQLQLQMLMSNKKSGYFCVARPDFEVSKKVEVTKVMRNDFKVLACMHDAARFWEKNVYTRLAESVNF